MKLKSFLRKFFLVGEVLEKVYSPINGEILVVEDLFGRKQMKIGKVDQSGGLVEGLWRKISNSKFLISSENEKQALLISNKFQNPKILILGLGCGTAAKILARKYSQAQIVGMEIDPKIVEIGKKYFGLGEIPNLKIRIADATGFVSRNRFDLIIVDLYVGQEFPKEAESDDFLDGLKGLLTRNGLVIFNRLNFNRKHQLAAVQFKQKLTKHFSYLRTREIAYNLLIFASLEAPKKV